jgi:molybdenum cofactor cytidylyltransferase
LKTATKIAVLILAAGEASRMQRPKQLLPWRETTLLNHCMATAFDLRNTKSFVVLGAHKDDILPTINHSNVSVLHNEHWKQGMGSSISFGVTSIQSYGDFDAVLIVVADQPLVSLSYLENMIQIYTSSNKGIVASKYEDNKLGVPVIFDARYFKYLVDIQGDKRAKGI